MLAEGIETGEQLSILRFEGCNEGQGFLLGRPSSLNELAKQSVTRRKDSRSMPAERLHDQAPLGAVEAELALDCLPSAANG